jgi:hypothetical protein
MPPEFFPDRDPISLDLTRPMNVKITPLRPDPSDEVVVTVSGSTFVPYLTADSMDLQINGSDITLDIHWISSPPPAYQVTGTCQSQLCATVVEPVQFELPSTLRSDRYEVTKSLGAFQPGTYQVEVNSSGRLTGTASTSFTVRELPLGSGLTGVFPGW